MCRNIKPLFNYDPPTTEADIRAASLQFVRKVSGMNKPTTQNEAAFNRAVTDISASVTELLNTLTTTAKPRNRAEEILKAKARSQKRFGTGQNVFQVKDKSKAGD
jgi:hypothetical protein